MLHCCYLTKFSLNIFLKMGAKPTTITGLSGTGDIMLTCFVNLSRNRTVGVRLGLGEKLDDILSSMNQVLESSYLQLLMLVKNCRHCGYSTSMFNRWQKVYQQLEL